MPFTLLMLLGPFLLLAFAGGEPRFQTIGMLGAVWLLADVPILSIYWLARLVRRAWSDGAPRPAR